MFPIHPIYMHPISLDERNRKAREWVIRKGKITGKIEYAWITFNNIPSRLRYRGSIGRVHLHHEVHTNQKMRSESYNFHHNHPSGQSLSDGDYFLLAMNPMMIFCFSHGHNNSMHCASWLRSPGVSLMGAIGLMGRMFATGFQAAAALGSTLPKATELQLKYFVPQMVGQALHERGIIRFAGLTTSAEVAIVRNCELEFQVVLEAVRLTK